MKNVTELRILRLAIPLLLALQVVKLVQTVEPAYAAPPTPPVTTVKPTVSPVPAPTPPSLPVGPSINDRVAILERQVERVGALERQVATLTTDLRNTQTQLISLQEAHRTHVHDTGFSLQGKHDYSCSSSYPGLSNICTRNGTSGIVQYVTTHSIAGTPSADNWHFTGPARRP